MSYNCNNSNHNNTLFNVCNNTLSSMVELNLTKSNTIASFKSITNFENMLLLNLAKQNDTSNIKELIDVSCNAQSEVGTNIVTYNLEFDNTTNLAIVSNKIDNTFNPIDFTDSSLLGQNNCQSINVKDKYVVKNSYYNSIYTFKYTSNNGPFVDDSKNWNILFDDSNKNVNLALAQNSQLHDRSTCLINCLFDINNNSLYLAGNSLSSYFTRDPNNNRLIPNSINNKASSNYLNVSMNSHVGFDNVGMYKLRVLDASYKSSFSDDSPYSKCWLAYTSYISPTTLIKDTYSNFKDMIDNNSQEVVSNFLQYTNGNLSLQVNNLGGGQISSSAEDIFILDDKELISNDAFMSKLHSTLINQMTFSSGNVSLPFSFQDAIVDFSKGEKLGEKYYTKDGVINLVVNPPNNRVALSSANSLNIVSTWVSYTLPEIQDSSQPLSNDNMTRADVNYNITCKMKTTANISSACTELILYNNVLSGNILDYCFQEFSSNIATQMNVTRSLTYHAKTTIARVIETNENSYGLAYSEYESTDIDYMKDVVAMTKIYNIQNMNYKFEDVAIKLDNKTLNDFNIEINSNNKNWHISLNSEINDKIIEFGNISRIDKYFPNNIPHFITNNDNTNVSCKLLALVNNNPYCADVYLTVNFEWIEQFKSHIITYLETDLLQTEVSTSEKHSAQQPVVLKHKSCTLTNAANYYYVVQTVVTSTVKLQSQFGLGTALNLLLNFPEVIISKTYYNLYDKLGNHYPATELEWFQGDFTTQVTVFDSNEKPIQMSFTLRADMLKVLKGSLIQESDLNNIVTISGYQDVDPLYGTSSTIQAIVNMEPSFEVFLVILPQNLPINNNCVFNHKHYFVRLNGSYSEHYDVSVYQISSLSDPISNSVNNKIVPRYADDIKGLFSVSPNKYCAKIIYNHKSDSSKCIITNENKSKLYEINIDGKEVHDFTILYVRSDVYKVESLDKSEYVLYKSYLNVDCGVTVVISNSCIGQLGSFSLLSDKVQVLLVDDFTFNNPGNYTTLKQITPDNGLVIQDDENTVASVILKKYRGYDTSGKYATLFPISITRKSDSAVYSILNSSNNELDRASFSNLYNGFNTNVVFSDVGSIGLSCKFQYSILPLSAAIKSYKINVEGDSISIKETLDGVVTNSNMNALNYKLYKFGNSSLELVSTMVKSSKGLQVYNLSRDAGNAVLYYNSSFLGDPSLQEVWNEVQQFELPNIDNYASVEIFNISKMSSFMVESSSYWTIAPPQLKFNGANINISTSVYFNNNNSNNIVTMFMDLSSSSNKYNPFENVLYMNNITFTYQGSTTMSDLTEIASLQSPLVAHFTIPGTTLEIIESGKSLYSGAINELQSDDILTVSLDTYGSYTFRLARNPLNLENAYMENDLIITLDSAFYPTMTKQIEVSSSGAEISFLSVIQNSTDVEHYNFNLVKYNCLSIFNWDYIVDQNINLCNAFNEFLQKTIITTQIKNININYVSDNHTLNTLPVLLKTLTTSDVAGVWSNPVTLYSPSSETIKFKLVETCLHAEDDLAEFLCFPNSDVIANALYITNADIMTVKNIYLVPVFRVTYGGKMKSMVVETQRLINETSTVNNNNNFMTDYAITGFNSMDVVKRNITYPVVTTMPSKNINKKGRGCNKKQ